jgi:DNA-binding transcriptional LysR family regulator
LSHAIAKLECELDVQLFIREGRRATLNEAGRTLLDEGRHLLRAADELERRVQRIANGWEAELRIAIDAIIPVERLYPLLERFYAAGHGTQIRLFYEVLGGTWDALATGRADLVIGAPGDMPARSGMATARCAHAATLFLPSPRSHPLAAWPGRHPEQRTARATAPSLSPTPRRNSSPAVSA